MEYFEKRTARIRVLFFSGIYILVSAFYLWAYPYPLFTGDTGSYVYSALKGQPNGVRPIGYSWFLEWMHSTFPTVGFVVVVQFLLLGLALLFFYITIDYLFDLRKEVSFGLAILLGFCPGQLYLAIWFMSDTLFIVYTLFWLASLFWMIYRPTYPVFVIQLILLFLVINTRYIGLFYPLVTIGVLIYSYGRKSWIMGLIVLGTVYGIYRYTAGEMNKYFGIYTFTEFSGWATANNASSMIPHINLKSEVFTDKPLQYINNRIQSFPDSMYNAQSVIYTHFIWSNKYPGKAILFDLLRSNRGLSYTRAWLLTGKWLGKYGRTLILQHPLDFIRYFVLLNTAQVFYPLVGLGYYHHDPKTDMAVLQYYGVNSSKFRARYDIYGKIIDGMASPINLLLWVVFFVLAGIWLWSKSLKNMELVNRNIVLLTIIFMVMYLGGSILTHPVHYRYLLPIHPLILMLCAVFLSDSLRLKEKE